MAEQSTNWRQWRVKTNLGTLASIVVALAVLIWQGAGIRSQIDDNSQAVAHMATAVEELSATVGLTIELDQRTEQLFEEIQNLRDTYSDQAWVTAEITLNTERFSTLRNDFEQISWEVDDIDRRVSEMVGSGNADQDLSFQVTDLIRQVAELHGRFNGLDSGYDSEWEINDLRFQMDDLFEENDELRDRIEVLESRE